MNSEVNKKERERKKRIENALKEEKESVPCKRTERERERD